MNYLLDTHALLWALFSPEKLGAHARRVLRSRENTVSVSVVSFWEISLKHAIGKLEFEGILPEDLPEATREMDISIIPIDPAEAASFHRMPRTLHRDPFDRLIAWQAVSRSLCLVSRDESIRNSRVKGLRTLW